MRPHLGYYVHHHGRGHGARASQVLRHLRTPATVLTSQPDLELPSGVELVPLPLDVAEDGRVVALPDVPVLHYAPGDVAGMRERVRSMVEWLASRDPALLVVDVSVEVTMLARLTGVPVAVMRQHGDRDDRAHRNAYAAASLLLAPWPAWLEHPSTPHDIVDATVHVGGFSRHEGRVVRRADARAALRLDPGPHVVVIRGSGGAGWSTADVAAAAGATPGWTWTVLGADGAGVTSRPNLRFIGWVDDPFPWLRAADVVVASAGHNTVMDAAAAGSALLVVPEPRPFDEQVRKAETLALRGAAVVRRSWPQPTAWPELLDEVRTHGPGRLPELVDGGGAARAAQVLDDLVGSVLVQSA